MKKKIGKVLIIIGWILLIISASMIAYNYYEVHNAYSSVNNVINQVDIIVNHQEEKIKEIEILGENYIGIVEIPSLDIRLPILKECNDANLKKSACNYYGDIYENENVILAGHNYPKFFGNIKHLNKDDLIYFTKLNGNKVEYKVDKIEVISSDDFDSMVETDYELSLFTCNVAKDKRITVRCQKQGEK